MFSNTLKELLTFFRSPKENIAKTESSKAKIKVLFSAYLIFLLPVLLSTSFLLIAQHFGVVNDEDHKLIAMLEDTPAAILLFLVVIMAPLWEELFFRLPLRWERAYIFKLFLLPMRLGGKEAYQRTLQQAHPLWQRNYTYIFYFTVLFFGLIHVANFTTQGPMWQLLLCAPLLVVPQLLLGSLLGFIRLRLGFWWGVLLHALHNLIFVGMALLAQEELTKNQEIHQTDQYKLTYQWYDAGEAPLKANNQIKDKEVSFEKISVNDLFRFLITNDSSRYEATNDSLGSRLLKLEFEKKRVSLDLKRLLQQALKEHLDLTSEPSRQPMELYELSIADTSKLVPYKQQPKEGSQINQSPDSLIFKYTNLKNVTASLQKQHWDRVLRYADDDYNLYEIRLANADFEQLEQDLSERYGIKISGPKVDSIWIYRLQTLE